LQIADRAADRERAERAGDDDVDDIAICDRTAAALHRARLRGSARLRLDRNAIAGAARNLRGEGEAAVRLHADVVAAIVLQDQTAALQPAYRAADRVAVRRTTYLDRAHVAAANRSRRVGDRAGLRGPGRLSCNGDLECRAARELGSKREAAVGCDRQITRALFAQHEPAARKTGHAAADAERTRAAIDRHGRDIVRGGACGIRDRAE